MNNFRKILFLSWKKFRAKNFSKNFTSKIVNFKEKINELIL